MKKKKLFFVTLLMFLCTIVFAQQQPLHYSPVIKVNESSMTVIAAIKIDGKGQNKPLDLGVFNEKGDLRGSTRLDKPPYGGPWIATILVYGTSGEKYTFKAYDSSTGTEWNYDNYDCTITYVDRNGQTITATTIDYIPDYDYGSGSNPCTIDFKTPLHWTPETSYSNSMIINVPVKIDGVTQTNPNYELGVFCDGKVRGSARLDENGVAFTSVFGENGDIFTFKLYNPEEEATGFDVNGELIFKEVNEMAFNQEGYGVPEDFIDFEVNFITKDYVAEIVGGDKYETLEAAVAAAQTGDEIKLLKDVTINESINVAKKITLNLNGKNITANFEDQYGAIYVKKDAELTITGEGDITSEGYAIGTYGTVNIKGGSLNTVWNCGTLYVSGGKIDYLDTSSELYVTDGVITKMYARDGSDASGAYEMYIENIETTVLAVEVPEDCKFVEIRENVYQVVAKVYVAQVNDGAKYESLVEAYDAAQSGDVVTLLTDATGAGLKINKDITIDFGGYTYKINQAVGSNNTESQGFQLLKNNTVTLKNGIIAIAENTNVKWMFNAYANVTIENVNVKCANMAEPAENEANYVLVVNNGGSATPTVTYTNVIVTNFPSTATAQIWLDPTTTLKAGAGLEDSIKTQEGYVVVYSNGAYIAIPEVSVDDAVAKIDEILFKTFAEAYETAVDGDEIVILKDITFNSIVEIHKNITIDINYKTLTGTAEKFFRVFADVRFENGNIVNNTNNGRCVETRAADIALELDDVSLIADNGASQPLTIGGSGDNIAVNINASEINAGKYGYAVIVFNPVQMNIESSTVEGWSALYFKGEDNSLGSAGTVVNVNNSEITGTNHVSASDPTNTFATIQFEDENVTLNVNGDSNLGAYEGAGGLNDQYIFSLVEYNDIKIDVASKVNMNSNRSLLCAELGNADIKVPARYDYKFISEGYLVEDCGNDQVRITKPVAAIGDVKYASLQAAIEAAQTGDIIIILRDFELLEPAMIDKDINIDIADYTITYNNATESMFDVKKTLYMTNGNIVGAEADVFYGNNGSTDNNGTSEANLFLVGVNVNNIGRVVYSNSAAPGWNMVYVDGGEFNSANDVFVLDNAWNGNVTFTSVTATSTSETVVEIGGYGNVIATITNCDFTSNNIAADNDYPCTIVASYGAQLTINGGNYISNQNVVSVFNTTYNGGPMTKVTITNGYFEGVLNQIAGTSAAEQGKFAISGGLYTLEPNADYIASGYKAEQNAEGLWAIVVDNNAMTITLNKNWNWFSSYVNIDGTTGYEKVTNALETSGIRVLAEDNSFTDYYADYGLWFGTLTSTSTDQMYMINMSEAKTITIDGVSAEVKSITLNPGSNWIPYPVAIEMQIVDAFANLNATDGDQLKSYANTADYMDGFGWFDWGVGMTMQPGQGYIYESKAATPVTFTYSVNSRSSEKTTVVDDSNNYWNVTSNKYPMNMNITAVLNIDGELAEGNYEIAAFSNGECRGSSKLVYVEYLNQYMVSLLVYGEDTDNITFKCYDANTDVVLELDNVVTYSDNARLGDMREPYVFSRNTTGIEDGSLSMINVYPNPTTTNSEINLNAVCDKVEVFNALGVKIAEYDNVDSIDPLQTAGVYVIRVSNNKEVTYCRLVVK